MVGSHVRMAFVMGIAVFGLGVAGAGAVAADDDALIETVIKGLEERDKTLSEFHVSAICRSWISDTQIEAERRYFREALKVAEPPPLQNGALYLLDIDYREGRWSTDIAALVADGAGTPFSFLRRLAAGRQYEHADAPGLGAAVVRITCDGKQVLRWQVDSHAGEVRPVESPGQAKSMIDLPLCEMGIWAGGVPAGEFLRSNPPYSGEGPTELDGQRCYRISYARDNPDAIGPFRRHLWVAPNLGFAIVRSSSFLVERGKTDSGSRTEMRASGFKEVGPGVWLPMEMVCEEYGYYKGFDKPWRSTRVYTVREARVGPGSARDERPFTLRFPAGVMVTRYDDTGHPGDMYIVGVGHHWNLKEREFIDKFDQWTPPPCDERLNRPLRQEEVEALLADVARGEAARKAKGQEQND